MSKKHAELSLKKIVAMNLLKLCEKAKKNLFHLSSDAGINYNLLRRIVDCDSLYEITVSDLEKLAKAIKVNPAKFFKKVHVRKR